MFCDWTEYDRERERYQARLKWERDQTAFIDEARQEGQQKGQWIGRIQLCQELLSLPSTTKEELTALAVAELRAKAQLLEQQIRARKKLNSLAA